MVMINRVYTRKGDAGETKLVGGRATFKDDMRVVCYGTIDELNSVLGLVRAYNAEAPKKAGRKGFDHTLQVIQQRLFDLGSELATFPGDDVPGLARIKEDDVVWLEGLIDRLNENLPPLDSFILPGGGLLNAHLHLARTVCRRAEREVVRLSRRGSVGKSLTPYLNRLSDVLFVMGRWCAASLGEKEILWEQGIKGDDSWP